jgi:uncharacterized phage infection (PIP) family protein YhgE
MQLRVLALCVFCVGVSGKNKTAALEKAENAISELAKHCKSAKVLAANKTQIKAFEADFESAVDKIESTLKPHRLKLADKFRTLQEKALAAAKKANSVNGTTNISAALNKTDEAFAALRNVSNEIQALDREQRHQISKALQAMRKKTTGLAHQAVRRAEKIADKVTDPLYDMGDSMERKADIFVDNRTHLAGCASGALDKVDNQIKDSAEEVEHKASESLQKDADDRHNAEERLQTLMQRAAARIAASEAMQLASGQNQDSKSLFLPMAATAVFSSACTAALMMRSRSASSMTSPLLPQ